MQLIDDTIEYRCNLLILTLENKSFMLLVISRLMYINLNIVISQRVLVSLKSRSEHRLIVIICVAVWFILDPIE